MFTMTTKTKETRTERIAVDVIRELDRIGVKSESYSDIIRRVLKMHRRGEKKLDKSNIIEDKLNSSYRL